MKITAIRNNEPFTDKSGVMTPVWGRFISGLQSNLAGDWGLQDDGNGHIYQLCGNILHINITLEDVTDPSPITLPLKCYDSTILATDNNIVLSELPSIVGDTLTIPAGTYEKLQVSGSAIVAQI